MNRAAVIGDPISQSKSPQIHHFWLDRLAMEGHYQALRVGETELEQFLAGLPESGLAGVNVTIPHKERVMSLVHQKTPAAQAVGAANLITVVNGGLLADNRDVDGVMAALGAICFPDAKAAVIGAGGAARAAIYALRQVGVAEVQILTRTVERGESLLWEFAVSGEARAPHQAAGALADASIIINASPMGMQAKSKMSPEIIAALRLVSPGALVFDMVYAPLETELLATARSHGLHTADGLSMLIGQARPAFRAFFGEDAPDDAETNALLRKLLLP